MNVILFTIITLFLISFLLPKTNKSDSFGTAKFQKSKKLSFCNYGFKIGRKALNAKESFNHAILIAPSGMGKTSLVISKQVFHLGKRHSLIITDPKLELVKLCSGYLKEKLKAKVSILNFVNPEESVTYNPFAKIKKGEIQGMMTSIFDITNKVHSEGIWRNGSIQVLVILGNMLHEFEKGKYFNFANLKFLLFTLQASPKQLEKWCTRYSTSNQKELNAFLQSEEKIRQGQLSGALAAVLPFCSEAILKLSSSNTIPSIEEIRNEKTVLFLGLPLGYNESVSVFITLFLANYFREILESEVEEKHLPLSLILEEFGNVKKINGYEQIISTVRSKKVSIFHCLQNLDQLSAVYGENGAEIIANNCNSWIVLPGIKNYKSLNYITQSLCGRATQESGKGNHSRLLLTPDEVRRLPSRSCLFINGNDQPDLIKNLRPLYKSWWLKYKYGLKNKNGHLVSKYKSVTHQNVITEIEYICFDSKNENNPEQEFQDLLKKHFPD